MCSRWVLAGPRVLFLNSHLTFRYFPLCIVISVLAWKLYRIKYHKSTNWPENTYFLLKNFNESLFSYTFWSHFITPECKSLFLRHPVYCNLFFKTHDSWRLDMEQYIWSRNVSPNKVFIAGIWGSTKTMFNMDPICGRIKTKSSKNFHTIESLGTDECEAVNQVPINCKSIISLNIEICSVLILFSSYHLSIDWYLINYNVVPVI